MAQESNQKYNMPLEQAEASAAAKKAAAGRTLDLSDLVGVWQACDQDTRGVVRVVLKKKGSDLTVQVFGSCHPTPCDWGVVRGIAYAESVSDQQAIAFSAQYDPGFKEAIVTGRLDQGSLIVETYNRFKDGSNRSNYYSRGYFCLRRRGKATA